jgi:hypothetical protein
MLNEIKKYSEVLTEGSAIRNYKELCKLLDEPILGGCSKKSQHKEWERYFSFEKDGQKYIITNVYETPLSKQDLRSHGNNNEYVQHIELLLLNYLSRKDGNKSDFTNKSLFLMLGMVNENYTNENYYGLMKSNEDITQFQVNHFYQRSYAKLNRTLFDALRNLSNRRLITVDTFIMVRLTNGNVRRADENEINIIRDIEREVLIDMGLESMVQIHLKFKNKEFYDKVYNLLGKHDITYYFNNINIMFTHQHIVDALEKAELKMQRILLNDKIIDVINNQAEKNYERNQLQYNNNVAKLIDKTVIGQPNEMSKKDFFKYNDVYLYSQKKLAEYLLKI